MKQRGRAWVFGDDVLNDGQIMDIEMTRQVVYEPERLAPLAMCGLDPTFASKVRPGDFVVAGERFGQGPMHIQGPLALAALGVAVLSASMARSFYRLSISVGLRVLPFATGIRQFTSQGDELEVDFRTGEVVNLTTGHRLSVAPLTGAALEILEAGGEAGWLRAHARSAQRSLILPT
ncbi:LeuD/DmdB family oxidoreductase small subunit [Achromobacter aloeverae]|uniref:3-isopropylmalate dehydratase n=1 Tax=Achromobacter aloeverae TaxID=1750518 RepID=A0A4Q1HFC4_9BURK|nr:3-isopropylmalate dehydratase [Achromobacter aloeverae]RXN85383.1 3-isopropylmalate dehydratase [Achromobacter aloeverae]